MKQSKLEAYRVYFLTLNCWSLAIRFNFDEAEILQELRNIHLNAKNISKLPKSCPALFYMQDKVAKNKWVQKVINE